MAASFAARRDDLECKAVGQGMLNSNPTHDSCNAECAFMNYCVESKALARITALEAEHGCNLTLLSCSTLLLSA